jgi:Mg-chelatase subunit ChlI
MKVELGATGVLLLAVFGAGAYAAWKGKRLLTGYLDETQGVQQATAAADQVLPAVQAGAAAHTAAVEAVADLASDPAAALTDWMREARQAAAAYLISPTYNTNAPQWSGL